MRKREDIIIIRDAIREAKDEQGFTFKEISEIFCLENGQAEAIAFYLDLILSEESDESFDKIFENVFNDHQKVVEDYRNGKKSAIGALIGATLKRYPHLEAKTVKEKLTQKLG